MGKIIFVLGGARSGKSAYALKIAGKDGRTAFIATAKPLDSEMKKRIASHKKTRPKHWKTFECQRNIAGLIGKIGLKFDTIIIDCLTLLVSGLMLDGLKENAIKNEINSILKILKQIKADCIIVSNEVGLGIVPENKLGRDFRDIAGRMNQITADKANEVIFIVSGLPWKIK